MHSGITSTEFIYAGILEDREGGMDFIIERGVYYTPDGILGIQYKRRTIAKTTN